MAAQGHPEGLGSSLRLDMSFLGSDGASNGRGGTGTGGTGWRAELLLPWVHPTQTRPSEGTRSATAVPLQSSGAALAGEGEEQRRGVPLLSTRKLRKALPITGNTYSFSPPSSL